MACHVSLIIPICNEEENVKELYQKVKNVFFSFGLLLRDDFC